MAVVDRLISCVVIPPDSSISINPTRLNVPNSAVDDNRLVWTIPAENSGTFAETAFFEWKGDAVAQGAPAVSFVNSKRLESGTYSNGLGLPRRLWHYKIMISGEWVDPEVNNQPPGGGPGGMPGPGGPPPGGPKPRP